MKSLLGLPGGALFSVSSTASGGVSGYLTTWISTVGWSLCVVVSDLGTSSFSFFCGSWADI